MKRFFNTIAVLALTAMCAFPAQAATIESIANADARLHYNGSTLTATAASTKDAKAVSDSMVDIFLYATRSCSGYEFPYFDYTSDGNVTLMQSYVDKIVARTTWVEEWVRTNVPGIVSNGMTKEAAQKAVFDYIATNYDYSEDVRDGDIYTKRDAADAYSLLCNKRGVCIAFSCAYRAMLEAVPFENGVVNWNATNPEHIQVAIVENDYHMWNAIKADSGEWFIYDTSSASLMREASAMFYGISAGEAYDCHGDKIWHY